MIISNRDVRVEAVALVDHFFLSSIEFLSSITIPYYISILTKIRAYSMPNTKTSTFRQAF